MNEGFSEEAKFCYCHFFACYLNVGSVEGKYLLFQEKVLYSELQIRGGIEDNSKIIFLISQ